VSDPHAPASPGFRALRRLVLALWLAALAGAVGGAAQPARAHEEEAGDNPTVLRDTEIETDIHTLAAPIWRAAGLAPEDVGVYLVQDDQINSFVAGGQQIFVNSGLIERAKTPNQLIGVLAHETGHIAGGHLYRSQEAMHNASIETIIAMVLGAAAAVAGRNGASLLGAEGVGISSYLRFSIAQEATADHAAMNFLDRACLSARGLLQFFETLQSEEMLTGDSENQWTQTHPLTSERIDYVRDHVAQARCSDMPDRPGSAELLHRMQVKLHAFLDPPSTTLGAYPASDKSELARYARAIAYYRIPDLAKAVPEIDGLIRDFPSNPYYRELKGQMLFENGRIREAIGPYQEAIRLMPQAALLRIALAQAYVETDDPALNRRAIAYLDDAAREESREDLVWHLLAVAYGRDRQFGMAALSLAEQALADGKKTDAIQQAQRARQLLARNTPGYARAEEIRREAKELDE
jgi:predicted Zn-dependent protease